MNAPLQNHMKGQTEKYMDMAKNVNLDKQVDGRSKSWGAAPLINHIPFDVQLVTSLERGMVRTDVSQTEGHAAYVPQSLGIRVQLNCWDMCE